MILSKLDNQTLPSITESEDGRKWWANFEFYPEAVGTQRSAFRGKMYSGQNFYTQTDCVVKFSDPSISEEDLVKYVDGVREFYRLAELFNAALKINVLLPCVAVMERTAPFYNGLFRLLLKNYNRVISENDCVLLEERVSGHFTTFIDSEGHPSSACPEILHQFAHFCFHETKGQLVAANFQGIVKDNTITLSCPVIHSVSKKYGPRDRGMHGIERFFQNFSKSCCDGCNKYMALGKVVYPSAPLSMVNNSSGPETGHNLANKDSQEKSPAIFMQTVNDGCNYMLPQLPGYTPIESRGLKESPPPPYEPNCLTALQNSNGPHFFGTKGIYVNNEIQTV